MSDSASVEILFSATRAECTERALVLQAMGIHHEIRDSGDQWVLLVAAPDATKALRELQRYSDENRGWHRRGRPLAKLDSGWVGVGGYVAILLLFTVFNQQNLFGFDWFGAGRIHSGQIWDGEWWRTFTALTLHLDVAHLAANLVFGVAFGLFAGQLLGSGFAWSSILFAAALGNAVNAYIQPPFHTAVGASTAVFAALGLLSAYSWKRRRSIDHRWAYRWAPVLGGVVLLAYTGIGGERTDVGAHVAGFAMGLLFGAAYGVLGNRLKLGARVQIGSAIIGLIALVTAWIFALGVAG